MGFALKAKRRSENSGPNSSLKAVAPAAIHNPYLAARREWDERYGDLVTRARNWRTIAVLCALIALIASGGMVWLSTKSRVVPFVVAIDHLGRPVASGIADQTSATDDRLKRASILNWVENVRTVTTDGVA
jgi:type IV secretory pathway TrbF-like protein